MDKPIKEFVGLDVHKDSIAVGVASAAGRDPGRSVCTVAHYCGHQKFAGTPAHASGIPGTCGFGNILTCVRVGYRGGGKPVQAPDAGPSDAQPSCAVRSNSCWVFGFHGRPQTPATD